MDSFLPLRPIQGFLVASTRNAHQSISASTEKDCNIMENARLVTDAPPYIL